MIFRMEGEIVRVENEEKIKIVDLIIEERKIIKRNIGNGGKWVDKLIDEEEIVLLRMGEKIFKLEKLGIKILRSENVIWGNGIEDLIRGGIEEIMRWMKIEEMIEEILIKRNKLGRKRRRKKIWERIVEGLRVLENKFDVENGKKKFSEIGKKRG